MKLRLLPCVGLRTGCPIVADHERPDQEDEERTEQVRARFGRTVGGLPIHR